MYMKLEEKDILLEEIRHYQSIVNQSINLQQEHESYYSQPAFFISLGLWARIVIFIIIWIITVNTLSSAEYSTMNTFLLMVIFCGYIYFLFIWPTVYVKKKVKRNKERINEIKSSLGELNKNVNPVHLPKVYINKYALSKLETYLINKRADTLKEALNLFEQERRHDQQMQEINAVQQLQEMTYKKANEATTLGWINLIYKK